MQIYSANLARHHFDTHTHAHTQLWKSMWVLVCAVLKAGIPACTCSTFHFNSSTLFAFEVICHGFVVCWFFFQNQFFVIPHHTLVSGYYVIPFSVCPSVRPSVRAHHFWSITWVFIHGIFSNFAYILLSAMSGMGLLMGKIRPFLTELLPFFVLEKWFLACYSFTVHDI